MPKKIFVVCFLTVFSACGESPKSDPNSRPPSSRSEVFLDDSLRPQHCCKQTGFIAGTMVQSLGGPATIQSIKPRTSLPGFHLETGRIFFTKVKDTEMVQVDKLVKLTIAGEVLFASVDQEFYLPESK